MNLRALTNPNWLLVMALAGCATPPAPSPSRTAAEPAVTTPSASPSGTPAQDPAARAGGLRYRCEHDLVVSVSLASGSATVDAGPRGKEVLLRDAGGVTPHHTVFSNPRLRAEFGVGAEGQEAVLHWLAPQPQSLRCTRA